MFTSNMLLIISLCVKAFAICGLIPDKRSKKRYEPIFSLAPLSGSWGFISPLTYDKVKLQIRPVLLILMHVCKYNITCT